VSEPKGETEIAAVFEVSVLLYFGIGMRGMPEIENGNGTGNGLGNQEAESDRVPIRDPSIQHQLTSLQKKAKRNVNLILLLLYNTVSLVYMYTVHTKSH
jgi:Na+/H+ antiporter NhaC